MKSIIFIGAPASGKGTQAKILSEKYNIPHISIGNLLRMRSLENDSIGNEIRDNIENGILVDDVTVISVMEKRLLQNDCNNGYIIDGFPRTLKQALEYEELLSKINKKLDIVIVIDITKAESLNRTKNRIICSKCQAVYNSESIINHDKCDFCNTKLSRRVDDNEKIFEKRFDIYDKKTKPLITYYNDKGKIYIVDGNKTSGSISKEIDKIINMEMVL